MQRTDWKNQIDRQIHRQKIYFIFGTKAETCRTTSFGEHSLPVLLPSCKQRIAPETTQVWYIVIRTSLRKKEEIILTFIVVKLIQI